MENGNSFPDLMYQNKLCEALDIYLDELQAGEYNLERRKRHKRRKIINVFVAIYVGITIPLIIFLGFFFVHNYDATKIYKLKTQDGEITSVINGILIETNKMNMLYIGNIKLWNYEVTPTDIISVDIYSDSKLLLHSNMLDSLMVKYDDDIELDSLMVKVTINNTNKEVYSNSINLETINISNEDNKINFSERSIELLDQEEIIKNLKEEDFEKIGDAWQKEIKKKKLKETISYYPLNTKLVYESTEKYMYKNIIFNINTNQLQVYIFHDDETIHTIVEKYVYNYHTEILDCQYGPCSTLNEVLEIMDPYITLLIGE